MAGQATPLPSGTGYECLAGGGEMGALMRSLDWSRTPLGPVSSWPQSLRTSVSTCLNSRFAIVIWWGPDLVMLYNDAYRDIIASKHPAALGRPGRECWPEIWPTIRPMLEGVLQRGEATWSNDFLLARNRLRCASALSLWTRTKCHWSALRGRSAKPVDGRCPRCGRSLRCSCPPLGRQQLERVSIGDGCLLAP